MELTSALEASPWPLKGKYVCKWREVSKVTLEGIVCVIEAI